MNARSIVTSNKTVYVTIEETAPGQSASARRFHLSFSKTKKVPNGLVSRIGTRLYVAEAVRLSEQEIAITIGPSIGLNSADIRTMLWHAIQEWNKLRGDKSELSLVS